MKKKMIFKRSKKNLDRFILLKSGSHTLATVHDNCSLKDLINTGESLSVRNKNMRDHDPLTINCAAVVFIHCNFFMLLLFIS